MRLPPPPLARVWRRTLSSSRIYSSCHCAPGREVQQPGTNTYMYGCTLYVLYIYGRYLAIPVRMIIIMM